MACASSLRLTALNVLMVVLAFGIGIATISTVAIAQPALTCGAIHTIERGDTLYLIAERAYANGRLYKKIFEANLDLMPNSASIEIDDQVLIPCLDGTGPGTRRDAIALGLLVEQDDQPSAPAREINELTKASIRLVQGVATPGQSIMGLASTATDRIALTMNSNVPPGRDEQSMRLLTGSGFAPYADKDLIGGGIVTDLLQHSIHAVAPDQGSSCFHKRLAGTSRNSVARRGLRSGLSMV